MLRVFPASIGPSDSLLTGWLGGLPDASNDQVTQKINGDWRLKLSYPAALPAAKLLALDNLILAQGQLYRIRRVKTVDDGAKRYVEVEAPHVAFDLQACVIENIETDADDQTLDGITAAEALTQLLSGTPFSVGRVTVDEAYRDYLDVLQKPVMDALKNQLVKKWGGELFFDNWTVSLLQKVGRERNYPIRQGRNITALKYTEDLSATVTRLHVIGYDGADIRSVNGGLDYLDSRYIGAYSRPLEGYATFSDEDDAAALKALALEYLQKVEVPQVSFDISLARLKDSPSYRFYAALETYELGDTALLRHDALQTDFALRCQERAFIASSGVNTSVKLGNADEVIAATLSAAKDTADALKTILNDKREVRADRLSGTINALKACLYASAEYETARALAGQGILLENNKEGAASYGAMYLGPGIFAIANTKDARGAWDWRTFGSGAGFSADQITTGTLSAQRIDIANLDLSGNLTFTAALGLLKSRMESAEGDVSALKQTAQTLDTRISTASGQITTLSQRADQLETRVAALGGLTQSDEAPESPADGALWLDTSTRPSLLKRYRVTTNADTGAETAAWETVNDRATMEAAIAALSDAVASLSLTESALKISVSKQSGDITRLKTNEDTLSEGLLAIRGAVDTKAGLEALATAQAAIEAAQRDVVSLTTRLTTIEQTATDITLSVRQSSETLDEVAGEQTRLKTYLRISEDGLELGKTGDPAKFLASNSALSVRHIVCETIAMGRGNTEHWMIADAISGFGVKHL